MELLVALETFGAEAEVTKHERIFLMIAACSFCVCFILIRMGLVSVRLRFAEGSFLVLYKALSAHVVSRAFLISHVYRRCADAALRLSSMSRVEGGLFIRYLFDDLVVFGVGYLLLVRRDGDVGVSSLLAGLICKTLLLILFACIEEHPVSNLLFNTPEHGSAHELSKRIQLLLMEECYEVVTEAPHFAFPVLQGIFENAPAGTIEIPFGLCCPLDSLFLCHSLREGSLPHVLLQVHHYECADVV